MERVPLKRAEPFGRMTGRKRETGEKLIGLLPEQKPPFKEEGGIIQIMRLPLSKYGRRDSFPSRPIGQAP
ncbi:hypothetical protein FACS1894216_03590 [Synergistales bacterium]|nr:hypothetical protein FACS1894216_03590 [Synergistales bacterium]